ncbi:MAG TPA: hypothetical protein PKA64_17840, partial [Myxococcota bacterium]|nr:hypothetical protein [Myxococcota bacterium]
MIRTFAPLLLLVATPALAFKDYSDDCGGTAAIWPSHGVTMSVSTISFSTAALRSDVEQAVESWDDAEIAGSDFEANHSTTGVTTTNNHDNINIIALAEITEYGCAEWPGTIAVTDLDIEDCGLFGTPEIVEADILLNCSYDWTTSGSWYDDFHGVGFNPYPYDLGMIVTHEMGHVVGLNDMYGPGFSAAMEGWASAGWTLGDSGYLQADKFQSSEDDHVGVRSLYPDGANNSDDLAIQSAVYYDDGDTWDRYCQSSTTRPSPYHDLSAMAVAEGKDPEDCPSTIPSGPTELYEIYELGSMDVTFQAINNGDTTRTTDVRFYLASDDTDPATWVELSTRHPTLGANTPYAMTERVQIPEGTATGWYYIVAEIDPDGALSEVREDNNTAVWKQPVWVTALPECSCDGSGGRPAGAALLLATA